MSKKKVGFSLPESKKKIHTPTEQEQLKIDSWVNAEPQTSSEKAQLDAQKPIAKKRLSIDIEKVLHNKLKEYCIHEENTMTFLVEKILKQYFSSKS